MIADEAMGDSVKVTVIATGFSKQSALPEPLIEALPPSAFFAERPADAGSAVAPSNSEPATASAASVFEDDLDVPAYLRQGKLLN